MELMGNAHVAVTPSDLESQEEKSARKTSSLPESSGALADAAATANATRPINTPAVRSAFIVRIYAVLGSAAV